MAEAEELQELLMSGRWRTATHADIPAILKLWQEQVRSYETVAPLLPKELPQIFDPQCRPEMPWHPLKMPMVILRVFERDGEIVVFRFAELVAEFQVIGEDREALDSLGAELVQDGHWLKEVIGLRSGWGLVPRPLMKVLARALRHTPFRPWPSLDLIGGLFEELGD